MPLYISYIYCNIFYKTTPVLFSFSAKQPTSDAYLHVRENPGSMEFLVSTLIVWKRPLWCKIWCESIIDDPFTDFQNNWQK